MREVVRGVRVKEPGVGKGEKVDEWGQGERGRKPQVRLSTR